MFEVLAHIATIAMPRLHSYQIIGNGGVDTGTNAYMTPVVPS